MNYDCFDAVGITGIIKHNLAMVNEGLLTKDTAIDLLDFKKNKEKNDMKILEIYQKRKENKLFIEYDNKIKEIESFDSIQSLINDTQDQLNALLGREDNDKITISVNNLHGDKLHDDITQVKIEEATLNYKNQQQELYNLIEEVSALLEMTSNYDEQIKILKKYGILNKDGKLNG